MKLIILISLFVACVFAFGGNSAEVNDPKLALLSKFLPKNLTGAHCPTEDIWAWKRAMAGKVLACQTEGACDVPETRNQWRSAANYINIFVTVICASENNCPITQAQVNGQIDQINRDFSGTNFSFGLVNTAFIPDSRYAEISAYSPFSSAWYTQIQTMKSIYAQQPSRYLNFYVTRQASSFFGTLLGFGTFPWDPEANSNTGGLWMNAPYVGSGFKTAAHEVGHCIGLWHTFHGDSEVSCNSDCYETVHQDFGDNTISNTVGDFCADTPAQPNNYNCQYPTANDCKGTPYTSIPNSQLPTLLNNIMAYTPDTCMQNFTIQQAMRAQCWVCNSVSGWGNSACRI